MGYQTKLTNNTDEATFQDLLSKDNIFKSRISREDISGKRIN